MEIIIGIALFFTLLFVNLAVIQKFFSRYFGPDILMQDYPALAIGILVIVITCVETIGIGYLCVFVYKLLHNLLGLPPLEQLVLLM